MLVNAFCANGLATGRLFSHIEEPWDKNASPTSMRLDTDRLSRLLLKPKSIGLSRFEIELWFII